IAIGEVTIGLALILGLFTGVAAFSAGMLTMSFGLAGVAGVNPLFFLVEVLLILAWRNAGYYGLDRYVLPALGTPWRPGTLFQKGRHSDRCRNEKARHGIVLSLPNGTVHGLFGPNGGGKNTAVRIPTTMLEQDEGTATVAGIDVVEKPSKVRERIGLSGQNAA